MLISNANRIDGERERESELFSLDRAKWCEIFIYTHTHTHIPSIYCTRSIIVGSRFIHAHSFRANEIFNLITITINELMLTHWFIEAHRKSECGADYWPLLLLLLLAGNGGVSLINLMPKQIVIFSVESPRLFGSFLYIWLNHNGNRFLIQNEQ